MTQPTASSVRTAKLPTAKLPTAKLPTASIAPAARAQVELLPRTPGVYRFRAETGRVLYVGRATNLRSRVGSYWGSLRDRPRLRRMMALVTSLEAVPCQSVHEAAWLERNLLERARPAWNRVRGGLEVPVWIRIEPARGGSGPRLRVVHTAQDGDVGPYLGGDATRHAVAAIERVHALGYTGELRSGSEREMARVRGVGESAEVSDAVGRVLRGEPSAMSDLRQRLVDLRGAAAASLAFELAAKIQAEIEALEWIAQPQRVTGATDVRLDLHGWCDGVHVSFEVRAGKVERWTSEPATHESVTKRLAATPPEWRPFVDDAAALAARLRPTA